MMVVLSQEVRQILGSKGDVSTAGPVTSIDLNSSSDLLVSGYVNGMVHLWDILKGNILKTVNDAHFAPIIALRFYPELNPMSKNFGVVSVDTRGCVSKLHYTKTMWMSFNVQVECLLDGAAGQVPSVCILPSPPLKVTKFHKSNPFYGFEQLSSSSTSTSSSLPPLAPLLSTVMVGISSEKSSFVVGVDPVKVLFKWPRPSNVAGDGTDNFLPCLSFGWSLLKQSSTNMTSSVTSPVMARGWGKQIDFLLTKNLIRTKDKPNPNTLESLLSFEHLTNQIIQVDSIVLAIEWLDEKIFGYLDAHLVLHIFDTLAMTELEKFDVSHHRLIFATYIRDVSSLPSVDESDNTNEKDSSSSSSSLNTNGPKSLLNSLRSSEGRLYMLGQGALDYVRVLSWNQRIESLVEDGEWLEALALSLDHYDSNIKSVSNKNPNPSSTMPPNDPNPTAMIVDPASQQIADLLLRYLKLAMENVPVQKTSVGSGKSSRYVSKSIDLVHSHYQMIASVCIEFCVSIQRPDILFGHIFNRFVAVNQARVILDILEPYILQEKVVYLEPEVMAAFVDHFQHKGELAAVERCLLHMDVKMLDFDSIVTMLKRHKLYSALIHVFTKGLDDFIPPLEIMLDATLELMLITTSNPNAHHRPMISSSSSSSSYDHIGYKALLFIHYCLKGQLFPTGQIRQERMISLQKEIISFLLTPKLSPSSLRRLNQSTELLKQSKTIQSLTAQANALKQNNNNEDDDEDDDDDDEGMDLDAPTLDILSNIENLTYPYLRCLLKLDCPSLLKGFEEVFDHCEDLGMILDPNQIGIVLSSIVMPNLSLTDTPNTSTTTTSSSTLDLSSIRKTSNIDTLLWKPNDNVGKDLQEFLAKYIALGVMKNIPTVLTNVILQHLATGRAGMSNKEASDLLTKMLQVLNHKSYNTEILLPLIQKSNFTRAALVLHKHHTGSTLFHLINANYHNNMNNDHQQQSFNHNQNNQQQSLLDNEYITHMNELNKSFLHFAAAIECYLLDSDIGFKCEVFTYIENEVSQVLRLEMKAREEIEMKAATLRASLDYDESDMNKPSMMNDENGDKSNNQFHQNDYEITLNAMKSAIVIQLAVLIELDRTAAVRLVLLLFSTDHKRVLKALAETPKQQFSLLCALEKRNREEVENGASSSQGENGSNNSIVLDSADLLLYVQLMAQFDAGNVYHYLSTHGDYPLGDCVKICRDFKITDAEAYLLERSGDISGALELTLQSIQNSLEALKISLRRVGKEGLVSMGILPRGGTKLEGNNANGQAVLKKLKDGQAIQRNLGVAIEICERSTTEGSDEQALWNYMLDRLLSTKSFLKLQDELSHHRLTLEAVLTEVMHNAWNKMSVYVPLAQIVRKITDDHSSTHLGELRDIIVSVLDASASEKSIYATSVTLVSTDVFELAEKRKKMAGAGKSHWGGDTEDQDEEDSDDDIPVSREALFAKESDTELESIISKSKLERLARRIRPQISLQDQLARGQPPSLLALVPSGVPLPEVPPEARIPGTLPVDARFTSEF